MNVAFDCLAVTDCRIYKYAGDDANVKAIASVVLNDQLAIKNLEVTDGEHGLYVRYPRRDDGRVTVFPLTQELSQHIENCVREAYMTWAEGSWTASYRRTYKRTPFSPDTVLKLQVAGKTEAEARAFGQELLSDMMQKGADGWELLDLVPNDLTLDRD